MNVKIDKITVIISAYFIYLYYHILRSWDAPQSWALSLIAQTSGGEVAQSERTVPGQEVVGSMPATLPTD